MRALRLGLGLLAVDIFEMGVVGIVDIADFRFSILGFGFWILDFGLLSWDVVVVYGVLYCAGYYCCSVRGGFYICFCRGGFRVMWFCQRRMGCGVCNGVFASSIVGFSRAFVLFAGAEVHGEMFKIWTSCFANDAETVCACFISSTSLCDFAGNEET